MGWSDAYDIFRIYTVKIPLILNNNLLSKKNALSSDFRIMNPLKNYKSKLKSIGRVEHWRQINGKKNSERLIFKFSHKKDIVRYASHYAQR